MVRITEQNRDRIQLDDEIDDEVVVLDSLRGYTIRNKTFSFNRSGEDMLELRNCVDCKIIDCTFKDKDTIGNFIHIRGANSKHNLIENCKFMNQTQDEDTNGGEAIIIGLDDFSGCRYETTVRKCEFINCTGDPEIISVKSADNVIENNCIRADCDGNITVRHGGRTTIQNNVLEGSAGGIRILGCDNKIIGNYHNGNNNRSQKRRPLIIQVGDRERDPNFRDNCSPRDEEGNGAAHAKVVGNTIEGNIYENCSRGPCVVWGWQQERGHRERPEDNTFRKNILIADEVDSEFLEFIHRGEDNTFKDNKMHGRRASRGDLPEDSVERLDNRPDITIPDTPCRAS